MATRSLTVDALSAPAMDEPDTEAPLLFCPFCRECYEGLEQCPVHELALVDFVDLPKQAHERAVEWTEPVAPWEWRYGRGLIALGALTVLVGFFLPLLTATTEAAGTVFSGLDLAASRAPNLWSIPFAAALFVVFLYRRLTPEKMRGARLAAVLLAVTPLVSLAYSIRNVTRAVDQAHGALGISFGAGGYVIAGGCAVLFLGALRFGAFPMGAELPHGATADDDGRGISMGDEPRRRRRKRRR